MTALPTPAYLRRHAVPAAPLANIPVARPRLVASWHVALQGHLECRWTVEREISVPSG